MTDPRDLSISDLTAGQDAAIAGIKNWLESPQKDVYKIRGSAGTGKTTLMRFLADAYGSRFVCCAPTNKAAKILGSTIGSDVRTIYSLLWVTVVGQEDEMILKYPSQVQELDSEAIIVVDEASMLPKELLWFIENNYIDNGKLYNPRWIFCGDPVQLPPVGEETSQVWSMEGPVSELTEVVRHDNYVLSLATTLRDRIQGGEKVPLPIENNGIEGIFRMTKDEFRNSIRQNAEMFHSGNWRVLSWRNKIVDDYNNLIRTAIYGDDVAEYVIGDVVRLSQPLFYGRGKNKIAVATVDDEGIIRDICEKQHKEYDFPLYDISITLDSGQRILVQVPTLSGERQLDQVLKKLASDARTVSRTYWKKFWDLRESVQKLRYGYSLTVHKSQGSTFDKVFVDMSDILMNRNQLEGLKCLYVAVSRASNSVYLRT